MRTRHLIGVLAAALAASSCSLETGDDGPQVAIYVSLDQGTLQSASETELDTVMVTVTARNVGYSSFSLTGPSDCLVYMEVYDNDENRVYSSAATCTGQSVTEELPEGEDKVLTFPWNGTNTAGARVPDGFYRIIGVAAITGRTYVGTPATIAVVGG